MKAKILPLFFDPGKDSDFEDQLNTLVGLFDHEADFLPPLALGSEWSDEVDAVVFPQLIGQAYQQVEAFRRIQLPILILTSEFGSMSMWDWEICSYLRAEGVETIAPYHIEQARQLMRALTLKREMRQAHFLVYQDNPGAGFQASIFKRFYWWEEECTQRMTEAFGIQITRRSFRELAEKAGQVCDADAQLALEGLDFSSEGLRTDALRRAVKLYLALREDQKSVVNVAGMGINCLNESHFCDTTPCLAWNLFYQDQRLVWGCEADTLSMLTELITYRTLQAPFMMTNLYPFLMGQSALKHEHIPQFPDVVEPENHVLAAHCGYFGLLPEAFSSEWTLRPKVLEIVDERAHAIDARLPLGPITLVKLDARLKTLVMIPAKLKSYIQYPGSHCLNGAVIHVPDGVRLMHRLPSHHVIILAGNQVANLELVAKIFGLQIEVL